MRKREPYLGRIILAFVIATVIFVSVFIIAYGVSYLNYQSISRRNNLIGTYIAELDSVLEENSCSDEILFEASGKLDEVGARLDLLEKRFGKTDVRVLEQKKLYSDLEIKHINIIKAFNEECGRNFTLLFFFYSNLGSRRDRSERIGLVLGYFKRKNPEAMVYSFDYDLDYPSVNALKNRYDLPSVPIVVVNEKDVVNVNSVEDLYPYV